MFGPANESGLGAIAPGGEEASGLGWLLLLGPGERRGEGDWVGRTKQPQPARKRSDGCAACARVFNCALAGRRGGVSWMGWTAGCGSEVVFVALRLVGSDRQVPLLARWLPAGEPHGDLTS